MKENDSDIFFYLITNTEFRNWVQTPDEKNNYFWKKWMEEHPESISDIKKAREFIERMQFEKAQLSSDELDNLLGKIIADEKPIYRSVGWKIGIRTWFFNPWLKVAAIMLIGVLTGVVISDFVSENPKTVASQSIAWVIKKNPKGQKSKIALPDGTRVDLNYESQLKYPEAFAGEIRKVELIGEAFFDVVHNDTMPFIVQTHGVEIEVLGTSFNIKSFASAVASDISLVTGKVKVRDVKSPSNKKDIYLSPGEQLRYLRNSGEMTISTFDLETITAWKEGIIIFKDASLEEFIHQLEKWYGVDFQIYGVPQKHWKINGRYQNEKLDDILIGLKFIYGLEYKRQGNNVILKLK